MAESEVELQVVITSRSLITIRRIERSRIGKESISIYTFVWSLTFVTRIVRNSATHIRMPTAFHFIFTNQAPLFIFIVQQWLIGIKGLLVLQRWVVHILTIQHIDITIVYQITQDSQTGIPFQIFVDCSLNISRHTNQVAFIFIEHTRAVFIKIHLFRLLGPVVPIIVITRVITIKSVKVAHSIRQIRCIQRQSVTWNKILRVIVKAEYTMMFGRVSRLDIQRVNILRILRTVTIIIDITQHTALETIIGIIRHRR